MVKVVTPESPNPRPYFRPGFEDPSTQTSTGTFYLDLGKTRDSRPLVCTSVPSSHLTFDFTQPLWDLPNLQGAPSESTRRRRGTDVDEGDVTGGGLGTVQGYLGVLVGGCNEWSPPVSEGRYELRRPQRDDV